MSEKAYRDLVAERKVCKLCPGLCNPSEVDGGLHDSGEIGPWTRWQGSLQAELMVVGQDWGDVAYFRQHRGLEGPKNPTNEALVQLVGSTGIPIDDPGARGSGRVFFTNAILCLKDGGLQGKTAQAWFRNCQSFLRRQVEIVKPKVVVALGEQAYRAVLASYGIRAGVFRAEVEAPQGRVLPSGVACLAVYHCGRRVQNMYRSIEEQKKDWRRVSSVLAAGRLTMQ